MYGKNFFNEMKKYTAIKPSAQVILPIVKEYVDFKNVIDVGCGIGVWLKACKDLGAENVVGIDGNVPTEDLVIDENLFWKLDLYDSEEVISRVLHYNFLTNGKYDLVISLEVAEHIPEQNSGNYLRILTKLGDIILFSAAIPGQGGEHHVNEQWPSYWMKKFAMYGYVPIDVLRKRIWDRDDVGWPYMQNIMFYVKKSLLEKDNTFIKEGTTYEDYAPMDLIHPKYYLRHALLLPKETSIKFVFKKMVKSLGMLLKKLIC